MEKKFVVSARKYRPQKFSEVVGQEAITITLRNAIKNGKLAHAYLFAGPRGVGKTTCARIFAKTINCNNPTPQGEACNNCQSCQIFNQGRSFNIHELDAASNNSVEDIRKLIEQVRIPPQIGKYNVYIIDEVHMLSQAAFNAFLKTLEEPPEHAIFIMATTEKHKILPTILSRCQVFDFKRIKVLDIVKHLKKVALSENIELEDDALSIIAQKADGALRDALSIFDQLVSFTDGKLTYKDVIKHLNVLDYEYYFKLSKKFLEGNVHNILLIFDEILQKGFDAQHFLSGLAEHFRNLLVARNKQTIKLLEVGENIKQSYLELVKLISIRFILKALDIINYFDINYKTAQNKRLHVELCLIKLAELTQKIYEQEAIEVKNKPENQEITHTKTSNNQKQADKIKQKSNTNFYKNINLSDTGPSLNGIIGNNEQLKEKKPQNEKKQVPIENTQFTKQALKQSLEDFADQYLIQQSKRLYSIMLKLIPEIDRNTIVLNVMNSSLKNDFDKISSKLLNFLKQRFNRDFNLVIKVNTNSQTHKPILNEEKYKYLVNKNPKLEELTKRLGLRF